VLNFITYVDFTADWGFMKTRAYPLLRHVADFYQSYARWNETAGWFDIPHSCAQEQCFAQGGADTAGNVRVSNNPPYDVGLAKHVLRRLVTWSDRLDRDASDRSKWRHMLEHLAPWELTVDDQNRSVFAQASLAGHPSGGFPSRAGPHKGSFNARYPIVYFAGIFPGEEIGPDSDLDTLEIAQRTVESVNSFNEWSPTNGMCMAWPPATRSLLHNASFLLEKFERAVNLTALPNFFPDISNHPDSGSGCPFENAGALLAINELFVMSANFTLRFFPLGWPKGERAAFSNLRGKGAFLTSGEAVGGEFVGAVRIHSEAGGDCVFMPPRFIAASHTKETPPGTSVAGVRVTEASSGTSVPLSILPRTGGKLRFATRAGLAYLLSAV
jgi:alpha-L-fucosidase 2